jgi:hypothetical protein
VGGISAADLPQREVPIDAPPEAVAAAEGDRAAKLAGLSEDLGCNLLTGRYTTGCQELLQELARAKGNAARATAAAEAHPSLVPALPWLTGGLGAIGAKAAIKITIKFAPKLAPVVKTAIQYGKQGAERLARGAGQLSPDDVADCLREAASARGAIPAALALANCLRAAMSRS